MPVRRGRMLSGRFVRGHNALLRPSAIPMTHLPRLAAFALTVLLASTAHAEQKFFVYSSKKPYAEALAAAQKSNEASTPKLPPADIERRLKSVYAAKPTSSAAWGRGVFEQCVAAKAIPVIRERVATCYISSFYLSMMVDLRKQGGDTKEKIGTDMTRGLTDPKEKESMLALINYYFDQPDGDANAQTLLDIRHFLTCASADQRPVSGTP
jgi:hypothetical protein